MGRNGNPLKSKAIACAMSAVLAIGLTPLPAFAGEAASAAPAAREVQTLTVGTPEQDAPQGMAMGTQYKVFSYSWEEVQDHVYRAEDGEIIELSVDVKDDGNKGRILVDGVTATIDLRGHEMNRKRNSADADGHVIEVVNGAHLTIRDSAGGGKITGGYAKNGGAINIDATSTCTIEGGTITGKTAPSR